ncbi:MAG TPA: hypothetical protein VL172_11575 [Kofleriaceae bacterium]|nr:hypothetical protein [Kofleriaceae bacterium]
MGIGDPQEAEYTLKAPIAAGTWRLVGDGIIIEPVDVLFEIIWRSDAGDSAVASFQHHFEPNGGGNFDAVAYEDTTEADQVPAEAGDQLVLRYSAMNATIGMAYIPNGDGASHNGRIPFIELPQ